MIGRFRVRTQNSRLTRVLPLSPARYSRRNPCLLISFLLTSAWKLYVPETVVQTVTSSDKPLRNWSSRFVKWIMSIPSPRASPK